MIVQIPSDKKQEKVQDHNILVEEKIVTLHSAYEEVPLVLESSQETTKVLPSQSRAQAISTKVEIVKSTVS